LGDQGTGKAAEGWWGIVRCDDRGGDAGQGWDVDRGGVAGQGWDDDRGRDADQGDDDEGSLATGGMTTGKGSPVRGMTTGR